MSLLGNSAIATCTQEFYYTSNKLTVSVVGNYGGDEREAVFLNDVKKVLPYILGLDYSAQ